MVCIGWLPLVGASVQNRVFRCSHGTIGDREKLTVLRDECTSLALPAGLKNTFAVSIPNTAAR
jgi:hypothetical protein